MYGYTIKLNSALGRREALSKYICNIRLWIHAHYHHKRMKDCYIEWQIPTSSSWLRMLMFDLPLSPSKLCLIWWRGTLPLELCAPALIRWVVGLLCGIRNSNTLLAIGSKRFVSVWYALYYAMYTKLVKVETVLFKIILYLLTGMIF